VPGRPVMMVHGMCCTGEVWNGFRTFFEQRGARVYTPTLRPELRVRRGASKALGELRFSDYVDDLCAQAREITTETGHKPAVIGHSMGGLLAQALAERDCVSAAVLISPSAPAGVRTLRARAIWGLVAFGNVFGLVPRTILPGFRGSAHSVLNVVPESERRAAFDSMVQESGRAFVDLASYPIDEQKISVPVLTVACTQDRLVPADLVRLTGKKYQAIGGELWEYGEHGHWLYAEPGWEKPAADLFEWLRAKGLA
jgi:pimeloyl-ACP methyl ester carboxylesterase